MRILFVSNYFPDDLRTLVHGTFKRMRMFIDAIKELAEIDMLFYVEPRIDLSPSVVAAFERSLCDEWSADIRLFLCRRSSYENRPSKWRLYGTRSFSFFAHDGPIMTSGAEQVLAFERCLDRRPDAIFAHRLAAMCPPLLTRKSLPPILFDLDDIEHVASLRSIARDPLWYSKALSAAWFPAFWWGERRAIRLARRTFVCSELDRRYLTDHCRLPGVATVPNAVAIPNLKPPASEPNLLFLGTYSYTPNIDAVEYLVEQIWPHVRRAAPGARLTIAGKFPERIPSYEHHPEGVEFTGFVDDLENLYSRSRVVCAPILSGAGTRVKIIEAAAYGKPVVSTRIGAEGLHLRDGRELLIRDEPRAFAQACIELIKDKTLCEQLGRAARETVIARYDRDQVLRVIQSHVKEATANGYISNGVKAGHRQEGNRASTMPEVNISRE